MKFRSIAVGAVIGALFMMPSVAAWAQADAQTPAGKEKRSISPAVTAPTNAARSATESAVRNARDDAARRAKARRAHLAKKKKRHAMRHAR